MSDDRRTRGRGGADSEDRYSGRGGAFSERDDGPVEGPIKSVEGWIVFIGNVNEEATEEDITDKFAQFGSILNLAMPLDRKSGFVKGYAIIEYEKKEEAEKAILHMNQSKFLEKEIRVDWAFAIEKNFKLEKN